jgi:O-antigen biosynthesis protein
MSNAPTPPSSADSAGHPVPDRVVAVGRRVRRIAARQVGPGTLRHQVALLLRSQLFDPRWYASVSGCDPEPAEAAQHYLLSGSDLDLSPHPLFDQEHFLRRNRDKVRDRNPLVAYLTDRAFRGSSTHPLFHLRFYTAAHPEARSHPHGVMGHYVSVGAANGFAPNAWYWPDPETEPRGLTDWLCARREEWSARAVLAGPQWSERPPLQLDEDHRGTGSVLDGDPGLVSVVVPTGPALELLESTVASVLAQTTGELEVLVVHPDGFAEEADAALGGPTDPRIRRLATPPGSSPAAALEVGAAAARGRWIAFCLPTAPWLPGHLAAVLTTAREYGAQAAYDVVQRTETDGSLRWATDEASPDGSGVRDRVFLGSLLVDREVLTEIGGIDVGVHNAAGYDLELRLLARGAVPRSSHVGVNDSAERHELARAAVPLRQRPRLEVAELATWTDVVQNRHLVDWRALERPGASNVVSVIVPTHADSAMTTRAVERLVAAHTSWTDQEPSAPTIEILIVDNGCGASDSAALDALPLRFADVRVLHEPVNRGFALANNLALAHTRGEVVVFLNNDTEVTTGWLPPLLDALSDPSVHGVQSLLIYPTGSIQSAGIAFPACGGVPHVLLQGFPVEDAAGIETVAFSAVTAAAVAMRRADVVALRGFDPIFRNGMEDVDLGLRMCALRPGRFTVRPDSIVVHHESRSPGRFAQSLVNRRLLLDRYDNDLPRDDIQLWAERGFDVVAHRVTHDVSADRRVAVPEPVLVRRPVVQVDERWPSLRWALKNPAPAGAEGERWGDTHFARRLALSLRRLGQQVIIDHRAEFDRPSGYHDDVVLVLRGVAPYQPAYGQLSLAWLISHPEMLSRREAAAYDRVFAASTVWSERMSAEWGIRIDPLLQATDPELFHPGRGRPDTGHPVLFVGSSRKVLRPLVRDAVAAGLPLSIYGDHWSGLVPDDLVKATYLPNLEVGEAYRRAGVVLNDHWEDMRADGFLSNRLFDAAASGARIITDDVAGLDGLFGRSAQVVRSSEELAQLAGAPDLDAVFGDDDERVEVARRIHRDHSFDARAHTLVATALELGGGSANPGRIESAGR